MKLQLLRAQNYPLFRQHESVVALLVVQPYFLTQVFIVLEQSIKRYIAYFCYLYEIPFATQTQ